ncbi:NAD(P)H-dependent oxidoreductase [Paenibacillus sp. Soil787]|uniref:NAD(P)H-dependent oxidoreductase n=1 Tax=Paenibacillus sp. Soil787 TaxID=1736411 RepID=UPI0009EA389D|nr:NAD(P)H-dependent oxidoreductase [Paenibacillus sp. Soil787]
MIGTESKKQEILKAYQLRRACKAFDTNKKISDEDFHFILETGRLSPSSFGFEPWNTNKKISDEDFHFILETGRLSPSSFGFEPWKFVVIQNAALREKLKPVSGGATGQLPTASHFVVILARREKGLRPDSVHVNKMWKDIHHMPEEVVQDWYDFYKFFVETELEDNDRLIFEWSIRQTYIALGNMMTAAAQIGIDSCPIEGFDKKQVTAISPSLFEP